jgi:gentisate 1,2-dioxygenase
MITTLEELYRGFEKEQLVPLWTEIGDLMPVSPRSAAVPHLWRWEQLRVLAAQAGTVVNGDPVAMRRGDFTSPATGGDVLPTIRAEMHRIARGARTAPARETGSSVYLVFDGSGTVTVGDRSWTVTRGDLFVVPSWQGFAARCEAGASDSDSGALDLFRFSDAPVFEALQLSRAQVESAP